MRVFFCTNHKLSKTQKSQLYSKFLLEVSKCHITNLGIFMTSFVTRDDNSKSKYYNNIIIYSVGLHFYIKTKKYLYQNTCILS